MAVVNYTLGPSPGGETQQINLCELFHKLDEGGEWMQGNEIKSPVPPKKFNIKVPYEPTVELRKVQVELSTMKNFLTAFDDVYKKYQEASMELLRKGWEIDTLKYSLLLSNSRLNTVTRKFQKCPEFDWNLAREDSMRAEHTSMWTRGQITAAWQKLFARQQKIMEHQYP
jgi:hypothetical protein